METSVPSLILFEYLIKSSYLIFRTFLNLLLWDILHSQYPGLIALMSDCRTTNLSNSITHTMKRTDPLLLAYGTLHCGMYPAGKVAISQPSVTILLASSVRTLVHCVVKYSRPPDLKSSSNVSLPFAWITGPATDPS